MPLYEFKCPSCGALFEEIVSSTGETQVVCPECGNEKPKRQLSTFATVGCASGCSSGGSSGFS